MVAVFTKFNLDESWSQGEIENCTFYAKIEDDKNNKGINGGRVINLYIDDENENCIISYYDGSWDIEPNKNNIKYCNAVIELLEKAPTRFTN